LQKGVEVEIGVEIEIEVELQRTTKFKVQQIKQNTIEYGWKERKKTYVSLVPYTNGLKLTINCVPSVPNGASIPDVGVTEKWGEDFGPK
jgi:hypothetical protein